MRTWVAAIWQVLLSLIVAAGAIAFFAPSSDLGKIINQVIDPDVGLGSAIGALLFQVYVASKNSNTDPNGKDLALVSRTSTVYRTVTDNITDRVGE